MWHCCSEVNFLFLFIVFWGTDYGLNWLWIISAYKHSSQNFFPEFPIPMPCYFCFLCIICVPFHAMVEWWSVPTSMLSTVLLLHFLSMQPRRSRGPSPFVLSAYSCIVFRPDAIFVLLRKAYKDPDLGSVCRMVCHLSVLNLEERSSLSFSLSKWSSSPCFYCVSLTIFFYMFFRCRESCRSSLVPMQFKMYQILTKWHQSWMRHQTWKRLVLSPFLIIQTCLEKSSRCLISTGITAFLAY